MGSCREVVVAKYLSGVEGTKNGTIIHEVLRGRDPTTVLREYGEYSEEHVRQCGEIRAKFLSSDLMKRVKRSFCEVAFVVTADGRPVKGKIDRLCEMDDGSWVVIDYKSMPVSGPDSYPALVGEFITSLGIYAEAKRHLTGAGKVAGYVYFTETGEFLHGIHWRAGLAGGALRRRVHDGNEYLSEGVPERRYRSGKGRSSSFSSASIFIIK